MQLPQSSNPCLFHVDFGSGAVQVSSTTTSPLVVSALDNVSGNSAKQLTVAAQPSLALSTTGAPSKYTSLSFGGAAYLSLDWLASSAATLNSFTAFVVASTSTPASSMDLFTFAKASGDGYTRLGISGSAAFFSDKNDSAVVVSGSGGTVDTAVHVYTLISAGGTITLRLDGATVASASVSGAHSYATATIGALNNNGTVNTFLTGNIFETAIFAKQADYLAIETYLTAKYLHGVNRTV